MQETGVETMLMHLGEEEHVLGAVTPPIFQNSLFVHENIAAFERAATHPAEPEVYGYGYTRVSNPTLTIVEKKLASLENCERAKVFGSGMAAISSAILSAVKAGSHVVAISSIYGPTARFLREYMPKFGVETTFVPGDDTDAILNAVTPKTTLICLESPSSLVFQMQDISRITDFARSRGICTMIDSTYNAGILMRPADLGVDLVCHTASKYFGGHSDIVGGVVAGSKQLVDAIHLNELELLGNIMAPFTAWLMLRGLRTLHLRLARHGATADIVCAFLKRHPLVSQVYHIGDDSHPQAELVDKYLSGNGGLFSFVPLIQDEQAIRKFADSLRLYQLGVSWGGFESLCVPLRPDSINGNRWIIRLFNGLENPEDLIADVDQALHVMQKGSS